MERAFTKTLQHEADADARSSRELVRESDTTLLIKGDQYRVTSLRGADGTVTHLRLREFRGVEYSAIRVAPPGQANAAALPPLFFNHSAVIVSPATYQAIATAPLLKNEFAHREDRTMVRDNGRVRYSGIYLFGARTYFEIMQPPPATPLGDIQIALWADREEQLKPFLARLAAVPGSKAVSHMRTVSLGGKETPLYEYIEPSDGQPASAGSHAWVWAMSVDPAYLRARYPGVTPNENGRTREEHYAPVFDKQRLLRDIDRITFRTQPREAEWLCAEFRAFGLAETRTPDGVLFSAGDTTFVVQRVAPVIRRTVTFHVVLNGPAAEQTLLLGDSRLSLHPDRTAEWVFEN